MGTKKAYALTVISACVIVLADAFYCIDVGTQRIFFSMKSHAGEDKSVYSITCKLTFSTRASLVTGFGQSQTNYRRTLTGPFSPNEINQV